jgi:hypothetical protein
MKIGILSIIAVCLTIAAARTHWRSWFIDANHSLHGSTYKQFQADDPACTENEVSGDYHVN